MFFLMQSDVRQYLYLLIHRHFKRESLIKNFGATANTGQPTGHRRVLARTHDKLLKEAARQPINVM